jgi:uncharacterized flavoprotein (TIGR03862 family)
MDNRVENDVDALVIGAGPAGLMAAGALAAAGRRVMIADAMQSPARKFLMAGKSGLNLTMAGEDAETVLSAYTQAAPWLRPALETFGPVEVQEWARGLGQPVFTGPTGRVFPVAMKASPLLRAWLARLDSSGVTLQRRWRWAGWDRDGAVMFDTPGGTRAVRPAVTVLACGGASWARLGSDGAWAAYLPDETAPFAPANMGFRIGWSPHMAPHFGAPLKNCGLIVNGQTLRGEISLSARGIEGGGIYAVSRALREGASLALDLKPDLPLKEVFARLDAARGKATVANQLRKALSLTPAQIAVLQEWGRPLPLELAPLIKHLPVPLGPPRPMDEAISTAGGVRADAIDAAFMLRNRPGTFVAGEMLDWEAPTGGYLLTACFATGLWAGRHAALWPKGG